MTNPNVATVSTLVKLYKLAKSQEVKDMISLRIAKLLAQ